jgi:hypothetical protein
MPAVVLGLAIGIYEALVLHRDVKVPTHRLGHTLHALVLAVIAVFCTMNAPYVLSLLNLPSAWYSSPITLQIAIGLFMAIKIHATSRAIKGSIGGAGSVGLGETWVHSILVGGLTIAAPYVWPFLAPVMPSWLGGTGK